MSGCVRLSLTKVCAAVAIRNLRGCSGQPWWSRSGRHRSGGGTTGCCHNSCHARARMRACVCARVCAGQCFSPSVCVHVLVCHSNQPVTGPGVNVTLHAGGAGKASWICWSEAPDRIAEGAAAREMCTHCWPKQTEPDPPDLEKMFSDSVEQARGT